MDALFELLRGLLPPNAGNSVGTFVMNDSSNLRANTIGIGKFGTASVSYEELFE